MDFIEHTKTIFKSIDQKDSQTFAAFLTDNAKFTFGNAPSVNGRSAIQQAVEGFFSSIKNLSHRLDNIWQVPNNIIVQGQVTYLRLDNKQVTIPFVDIFVMNGSLIKEYLIYIDISPLMT